MNICIPVTEDNGLDSRLSGHFGSAPVFMIVDTETGACRPVPNANHSHGHGMCQPLASLGGQQVDAAVVGGIGVGALAKLQAAGIRTFKASGASAKEACDAFTSGTLVEITPAMACRHQGHGDHQHGPHGHGPQGDGLGGPHGSGRGNCK